MHSSPQHLNTDTHTWFTSSPCTPGFPPHHQPPRDMRVMRQLTGALRITALNQNQKQTAIKVTKFLQEKVDMPVYLDRVHRAGARNERSSTVMTLFTGICDRDSALITLHDPTPTDFIARNS